VKYPFSDMEVGDSFLARLEPHRTLDNIQSTVSTCAQRYAPKRFITKKLSVGVRCWRIE